jgi:hypothetical protein
MTVAELVRAFARHDTDVNEATTAGRPSTTGHIFHLSRGEKDAP